MLKTALSVNLNVVAQVRNRRDVPWPSLPDIARQVLRAGAAGITIHPRPDQRHIRTHDVFDLAQVMGESEFEHKEFNIEGYPEERFFDLVKQVRPDQATLVPDDPAQATSDHGWDLENQKEILLPALERIQNLGIRSSIFMDATPESLDDIANIGCDRIEVYTGPFGAAFDGISQAGKTEAKAIIETERKARANKKGVNGGHDLTAKNVAFLYEMVGKPLFDEVSIGHCFWVDAWVHGIDATVQLYNQALGNS